MFEERNPAFKIILLLVIIVVGWGILLQPITKTDDNIKPTLVEKNGNYNRVYTIKGISQEKVIKLIKNDEEYINKENDKNKKINEIKENSYYAKLKKSNILRENNTIDQSKHFDAIKFVKDSNVVSNMVKDMPTKELIDNFNQMNDQDRISAVITIISRNEFKNEYTNQLELANVTIQKEESKNTKEIEELEKSFNEWFNTKIKQEIIVAKQIRKHVLILIAMILGAILWFIVVELL